MNVNLNWKVLIPFGLILFFFGGFFISSIGSLGFICLIFGIVDLFFPKLLQKTDNLMKGKGNILVLILFAVALVVVAIYYLK